MQPAKVKADDVITIERLDFVRVHVANEDNNDVVLQIQGAEGDRFYYLNLEALTGVAERLTLDAKILSANAFTGRA